MQFPKPGSPVRGSKSGQPLMALFDLLGRHWAMGILWNLCADDLMTFGNLEKKCETITPSTLSKRLKELQAAGFIEKEGRHYRATALGRNLHTTLVPLSELSVAWSEALEGRGLADGKAILEK
ncbi:MAG: helix-turn-helix transcriptional regulator [Sneathiellales bacterium]|nr:helix-turn-helix transcriptional regulator [Sneathiellales bacterium]